MKKKIIVILCFLMFTMVIGYSALSTSLKITGTGNIASNWNIYFESITTTQITGGARNTKEPTASGLSAIFNYDMMMPGDKIVYEIILKNSGDLDAVISNVYAEQQGITEVSYTITGIKKGDKLTSGTSKKITISIEFDSSATKLPTLTNSLLTINITCIQDVGNISSENLVVYQPMLMVSEYGSATSAFLSGPITRGSVEKVVFTDSKTVPSGVVGSWDVSANKDKKVMAWYFDNDGNNLYEVYIGQDGGVIANHDSSYLFRYCSKLTTVDFTYFDTSKATNMAEMFSSTSELTDINLSNFNTSNVKNMSFMFYNSTSLKTLDLSNFNTSKVTDMYYMFGRMSSLISLDISSFNTSKVTNMARMFQYASSLTTLDLSNFDTSNATAMYSMFTGMSSLISLDISSFDTGKVTSMEQMFMNCSKLVTLDVTSFNTSKVTSMSEMFSGSSSLISLDLSSFDTSNVSNMYAMFWGVNKITTIYVSNRWNVSNVTSSEIMFSSNHLLVGENGTKFNPSYLDKTYARVDTVSTPGYFTYKAYVN